MKKNFTQKTGFTRKSIFLVYLFSGLLFSSSLNAQNASTILGNLANYHMVFTNGSVDANWQGATKGFAGNVAVNGILASERTSGTVPYAGTIFTNDNTLSAWQNIINANASQASRQLNETARLASLQNDLEHAFDLVNAMTVTPGFESRSATSLNNLNTQNNVGDITVINITSGFQVSSQINITGDANDLFIFRWDTDADFSNGYNGQVKFQSGGAIVPLGNLTAANFIHVAGDINSSGGGSNPPAPFPQGPRSNNGTGTLISGGADFSGGGFFTGYWLTTGTPAIFPSGEQPYGQTASLSNGIFVGGWYSKTTKFSMTSGTSGVYVGITAQTFSLGNRVWFDANGNGIDDSENGIANVTVNLYRDNNNDNYPDSPYSPIATTITNSNGNYLFSNLLPGNYIVGVITPAGYIKSTVNGGDPDNNIDLDNNGIYAINGGETFGWAITLGANNNLTYDFGFITPTSSSVCTGSLLTNANGNYGGFEIIPHSLNLGSVSNPNPAGTELTLITNGNISANKAIIASNGNAIPGGIFLLPHTGNWLLLLHPNVDNERLWFKTVTVTPGATYNFCVWGAGAKQNPASMALKLFINGVNVGSGTIANGGVWTQICGSFTVPSGVTSMEISIKDPTAGSDGVSHFIALDDICISQNLTVTLGNRVWLDANKNGLDDNGEPGITNITVRLYNDANNDNIPDGPAIQTTVTDNNGNYYFINLAPGKYIVGVVAPNGYSMSPINGGDPDNNIDGDNNGMILVGNEIRGQNINITTTSNLTYDFGLVLPSLGNRVWFDANANGLDDNGETGIANVTLHLYNDANNDNIPDGPFIQTAVTNSSGNYLFNNLLPGRYIVGVVTSNGYTKDPVGSNDPNNNIDLDNNGVNVSGNEIRGNNINLAASNLTYDFGLVVASLGNRVWLDANYNGLDDNGETGITNATVNLYNDANNDNIPDGPAIQTTVTDNNGNYIFINLAPGKYIVGVVAPNGYAMSPVNGGDPDNNIDGDNNGMILVGNEIRGLNINLGTSPNLTYDFGLVLPYLGNRVWLDANNNGLDDNGETGIANATLHLYNDANNDNIPDGPFIQTAVTDNNGNYLFKNLVPGRYIVGLVTPNGYTKDPVGSNDPNNNIDLDNNGVNISGNEIRGNNFNLTTGNLTYDFGLVAASLGNRVWLDANQNGLDDNGESGIANTTVRLYLDANNDNIPDGPAIQTTVTDNNGNYIFINLAPGKYIVGVVVPNGYAMSPVNGGDPDNNIDKDNNGMILVGNEIRGQNINLGTNPNLTYDFGLVLPTTSLGNRVWLDLNKNGLDDNGEAGIPNVTVKLYNDANNDNIPDGPAIQTKVTDVNGNYLFTSLAPGKYIVGVVAPNGYTMSPVNGGDPDNNTDLDNNGMILAGNEIRGQNINIAGTSNLTYDFGLVLPSLGNRVWLDVDHNGLEDPSEVGVSNVTVRLYNDANNDNIPDGPAIKSGVTDNFGYYQFNNLLPGRYIVGIVPPAVYAKDPIGSNDPNNNIDKDNNGVISAGNEIRGNNINLNADNMTYDFGLVIPCNGSTLILSYPPDINQTHSRVSVTGNVNTNDHVPPNTTYGSTVTTLYKPGNSHDTLSIRADGSYNFIADSIGKYVYEVSVCIPDSGCKKSLLTVWVVDPRIIVNPPTLNTDYLAIVGCSAKTVYVLANDTASNHAYSNTVAGTKLNASSLTIVQNPLHGTAVADPALGVVTYTPNCADLQNDTIRYRICDNNGTSKCDTAMIVIRKSPPGSNSTSAADDYATTGLNQSVSGNVKTNDTDPEGDAQTIEAKTVIRNGQGTLVLQSDGNYSFTPAKGYSGPVEFVYTTCDNGTPQACTNATLHILVTPGPDLSLDLTTDRSILNTLGDADTLFNVFFNVINQHPVVADVFDTPLDATTLYPADGSPVVVLVQQDVNYILLPYAPVATSINGTAVSNAQWRDDGLVTDGGGTFRKFTFIGGHRFNGSNTTSRFGLSFQYIPTQSTGRFKVTGKIQDLSGGDSIKPNNTDAEFFEFRSRQ